MQMRDFGTMKTVDGDFDTITSGQTQIWGLVDDRYRMCWV